MGKGKLVGKILVIALVFVMIGTMLGGLLGAITLQTVEASTLADGKGMWIWKIWELGENVGQIINKLESAGVEWVTVKCGDSDSYYLNPGKLMYNWLITNGYSDFSEVVTQFHNAGIKVFGWHYVYSYDLWGVSGVTEADVSNQILDISGINGLIIDAEAEYEGEGKGELAENYMIDIRNEHPTSFIAYSTFARINAHLWFPYIEFGRYCDAVMPQAYWKDRPTTPQNEVDIMKQQWDYWHGVWEDGGYGDSVKPLIPVGQSYSDAYGYASGSEITAFCTAVLSYGYDGVSLWRYGTMTSGAWSAYAAIGGEDNTAPTVDAFDVTPGSVTLGNAFTISYTVSDTGGSGLGWIQLWRKYETASWEQVDSTTLSGVGNGSYSGSFSDIPLTVGTYWYGIHVGDDEGNWVTEGDSGFSPIEVEVIPATPATIYVPDNYLTIQAAVNAANPRDTIIVRDGNYTENVDVNKDHLTIKSESGPEVTLVQATDPNNHIFHLNRVDGVTINGFTIKGASSEQTGGISLERANFNDIVNNIFSENWVGVGLFMSYNNTIRKNTFSNNTYGIGISEDEEGTCAVAEAVYRIGITAEPEETLDSLRDFRDKELNTAYVDLYYQYSPEVTRILVAEPRLLVQAAKLISKYMPAVRYVLEEGGEDLQITEEGIEEMVSFLRELGGATADRQESIGTTRSMAIMSLLNEFEDQIRALAGKRFSEAFQDSVYFTGNKQVTELTSAASANNIIYLNNFRDNTSNVRVEKSTNTWNSVEKKRYNYKGNVFVGFLGNYWDDYTGSDADGDGIGETPYPIDSDADNYPLMEPFENYEVGAISPWPMFRHDRQRTGRSPYVGPKTSCFKWSFATGAAVQSSPVIGPDGTIHIGSLDGNLYAINPNGSLKWSYEHGGMVESTPAIGPDGTIYIGESRDHKFYAISPEGTLKWYFQTGGRIFSSPALGADGTIYFCSYDGYFYALNLDSTLRWSYYIGGYAGGSSPAIAPDGTIYVFSEAFSVYEPNTLYALNPDGTLKWSYKTLKGVGTCLAIGADGTIYFGSYDNKLYALNPNGTLKWSYDTGGWVCSSPAIGSDGTIYFGSRDKRFYALNADGSLKWWRWTEDVIYSSPAIGADGVVYFGSYDGYLYAFNPDSTLKWRYQTGDSVHSSPAIDANGTLYVGSTDGKLYAFGPGPDTTPPTVFGVSPKGGATDVPVNIVVTATFSEAMDSSTIATESFTLEGSEVSGTVTYDSDTYTATFTPDADLDYNHEYTATLSTAITDLTGNPLAEAYNWSFTTTLGAPKFLTLPFGTPGVKVQQGWIYTFNPDPNAHQGVDYIKGEIDNSSTWQSFDVVAAADGWAMWSEQPGSTGAYGQFVLLQHEETDHTGDRYLTLYAHLESVASGIPYQDRYAIDYDTSDTSKWKYVEGGEVIGVAGNSGASNTGIHLHFEVNRGDPYDLYTTRDFYPGGNNYTICGSNYLWTTDPPSYSIVRSNVVVTNPLAITVLSDGFLYFGGQLWCFQGDTISAEFTVTNRGLELVTLDKLVVGGRDPNGEVVDFTTSDNIALEPGNSYDYQGQLVLPDKTGAYSFFCTYSTSEEGWNTCMDVELNGVLLEDPREADEFRTKRIEVLSTELLPSALLPPAVWEKVEGPWNEGDCTLSTVAVDPSNPNTILAAVSYYDDYWGYVGDELYRSTDGGATWPPVGEGLPRIPLLPGSHLKKIEELAIAPSNPNVAYAGLSSGGVGVYRSTDGGITWAPTSGPFVEVYFGLAKRYPYVLSVAIDEGNPDVVYVGTEHYGVWKTTDGGEHWHEWGRPSAGSSEIYRNHVDVLEVVSTDPRVVYGSGYNYVPGMNLYYPLGIYHRVDSNGDGWCKKDPLIIDESYPLPLTPLVTDISVAPDGQTIYFATNHNTVYLSEDGGASWENASGGGRNHLPESGNTQWYSTNLPCSLIVNPAYPNVIYASHAASGVWWSYNSGEDWFPAGLQDVGVAQTVSDRDTNVLYAVGALNGSLYKLDISSKWVTVIRKHSPGELRVYDIQGNVTGVIDGQIVENIPNSGYDPSSDTVVIWAAVNSLVFEVVGTEDGAYGLTAGLVGIDDYTDFSAVNIPTSADAAHQYTIDWDALSEGEEGVTIQIDSDGDGDFEETILTSQPNAPGSPSPANHATGMSVNTDLSWIGGDPDVGDTVTYDVYFGTSSTLPLEETIGPYPATQSSMSYDPGTLVAGTTYYWQIVARDNHGIAREGPVWDFTTGEDEPSPELGFASLIAEGKLEIAYRYKSGEGVGGWMVFNPDWSSEWNTLTMLYKGRGYWIKVNEACTLNYGGNNYQLDAGWNLIGWLGWEFTTSEHDNPPVADGFASILDKLEIVYGYRSGEGVGGWTVFNPDWPSEWDTLTTLYKGRGCWIKVNEACTLNYGGNNYQLDAGWNLIAWLGW